MGIRFHIRSLILVSVLVACSGGSGADEQQPGWISEFGRYEGYSEPRFDGWVTSSQYIEMRDGVKLAVDVTRPAMDGVPVDERLPVVLTHSRYHRNPGELVKIFSAGGEAPEIDSTVDAQPDLQRLVRHGYVVASVGVRGSGASYGRFEGLFSAAETRDAFEIIEWLAAQPWSSGNVGMYGGSYLGITQYMAASQAPPALKAIFPRVAAFDMYDLVYPGGVFRDDMLEHWAELTRNMDREWPAPPVDADSNRLMLSEAMEQHKDNWDVMGEYSAGRFRDHDVPTLAWARHGPSVLLESINEAKVPAYHFNGWFDVFVADATLWYANYEGPQKLAIGAWSHGAMPDSALMAERWRLVTNEQHRWFDYWLKGIDNGVTEEPPIHYAVMEDPGAWRWRSADTWPPAEAETQILYLGGGPSGSVESVNDGGLTVSLPADRDAHDAYTVDPTTTTGASSRWDNAVGGPMMSYSELAANDRKALTYTTPPLESDMTVVGHPVVTLYVTATGGDADFHVLLEEVDGEGAVRYITEGVLRGSHRNLDDAPWDNMGLPYQRSFESDRVPLPSDEPTELVMDLHPTATVFNAGHRIRVTITGADADNTEGPPVSPPPTMRVYRSATHASHVALPIIR
jgi:putative CocE/NonD family hydrolase